MNLAKMVIEKTRSLIYRDNDEMMLCLQLSLGKELYEFIDPITGQMKPHKALFIVSKLERDRVVFFKLPEGNLCEGLINSNYARLTEYCTTTHRPMNLMAATNIRLQRIPSIKVSEFTIENKFIAVKLKGTLGRFDMTEKYIVIGLHDIELDIKELW